jgi:DNA-directed RNA polymerase specialized sigma24 family protein
MSSIGGGTPIGGGGQDDESLVQRIADGDQAAYGVLYSRYFPRIYDFALRLTRDKEIAALSVQVAFLRALGAAQAGEAAPFRLQLYAAACLDALERLRARRGPLPEEDESFAQLDGSRLTPQIVPAELPDLGVITWQVCRDTKPEEYELLDLGFRQHLEPGELASVLRTRVETVEGRLARLRGAFEGTFSALLLYRRGRRACLDLDMLIGDGGWSASVRRSVQRHLQSCQTCQATRRRYPAAIDLFAALTLLPAPAGWQETILERLQEAARTGSLPAGPAPAAAPVAATAAPQRRPVEVTSQPSFAMPRPAVGEMLGGLFGGGDSRVPLLLALGGGMLFVIILITALCTTGAFDSNSGLDSTKTPTSTATPRATRTATATGTPTSTETFAPLPTDTPTDTPLPADTPTDTPLPPADTPTSPPLPTDTAPPVVTPTPP